MIIKVRYLFYLIEIVHVSEEEYEINKEEITVEELVDLIKSRHPTLKNKKFKQSINGDINIIKNGRYVNFNETIKDGDVIVMFPPIMGG